MTRRDYLSSFEVDDNGCWIYTGSINNRGYGTILGRAAHRWFYERFVGPIPGGLPLDHLCRVKACVNPEHLEPVTDSENARRRPDTYKSQCLNGHAMTPENTIVKLRGAGRTTVLNCRTCKNERRRVGSRAVSA